MCENKKKLTVEHSIMCLEIILLNEVFAAQVIKYVAVGICIFFVDTVIVKP